MKHAMGRGPHGRIVAWAQGTLFSCAVLLLGYCGFAVVDAWVFQRRESSDLDRLLRDRRTAGESTAQPASAPRLQEATAVRADGLIGRIEIPRLRLSAVVIEGSDGTTLGRAVGH